MSAIAENIARLQQQINANRNAKKKQKRQEHSSATVNVTVIIVDDAEREKNGEKIIAEVLKNGSCIIQQQKPQGLFGSLRSLAACRQRFINDCYDAIHASKKHPDVKFAWTKSFKDDGVTDFRIWNVVSVKRG